MCLLLYVLIQHIMTCYRFKYVGFDENYKYIKCILLLDRVLHKSLINKHSSTRGYPKSDGWTLALQLQL